MKGFFFVALWTLGLAAAASAYVLEGQRWFSSPVTIQMNLSATSYRLQRPPAFPLIDGVTSWESVYSTSAAIWNQYMANLQINTYSSNNSNGGQSDDSVNEAFFGSSLGGSILDANTLGLTIYSYDPSTNAMIEADTAFNPSFQWNSYRGPFLNNGVIDLRRVAIHELGHIIGLDHPDQAGQNVQAIMNSVISNIDNVTADDIAGAQALYGVPAPGSGAPAGAIVTVPNPPDFDGDGKQDLLWREISTGEVGIWLMNGSTAKAVANIGAPPLSWVIINTGDFDGDGRSDILWQDSETNQYGIWFMNGTQVKRIQNFTLPSYAGQICCVADFDGDGLADLVTFNHAVGAIYFWKNTGSLQFVPGTSYPVGSGWLPLGTAYLNGAGASPALIWRNAYSGEIAAWFMSSFYWSAVLSLGNPGNDVELTGFGDFSGDGRQDLLLFNISNNFVGYWRSNGVQPPTSVPLAQVSGTWVPVGAENLQGTTNADIIWRQSSTGALGAWTVNGSTASVLIGSLLVGSAWQLQPKGFTP